MKVAPRLYIDMLRLKIELFRLGRFVPQLRWSMKMIEKKRQGLRQYHEMYVSTVSNQRMAISLELAGFLMIICETIRPRRILDLGSGFSSFVFRCYAKDKSPKPEVWSVDDSEEWLQKTSAFLALHGLTCERMITWNSFRPREFEDAFDLILHDLGSMDLRKKTFGEVLYLSHPRGLIILDDLHKQPYKLFVEVTLNQRGFRCLYMKSVTIDKFQRFAGVVAKTRA